MSHMSSAGGGGRVECYALGSAAERGRVTLESKGLSVSISVNFRCVQEMHEGVEVDGKSHSNVQRLSFSAHKMPLIKQIVGLCEGICFK